jgi:hypothetical protein
MKVIHNHFSCSVFNISDLAGGNKLLCLFETFFDCQRYTDLYKVSCDPAEPTVFQQNLLLNKNISFVRSSCKTSQAYIFNLDVNYASYKGEYVQGEYLMIIVFLHVVP